MRSRLLLLAALFGPLASAQDCTQTLPINILDQKTGQHVLSVKPEWLQARAGETEVLISGIRPTEKRRVLVLMDQSGSMALENNLGTFQKEALQAFEETIGELLGQLPAGTSVAYGFFNDTSVFTPEFISDPEPLRQAIAEAKKQLPKIGKGDTPLFDALHRAMLRFSTPQPGDTIVVVTDAGENKSRLHPGKVEKEIRGSGLRLVLVLVEQHKPVEALPYVDVFTSIAQDTGGAIATIDIADRSWRTAKDSDVNRQALRKFWTQEALGGFLMQVQVPASLQKPKKWSVRFSASASPELKHAIMQYPVKLEPCPLNAATVH